MQIAEQIRADVNSAMKAGDRDRAQALRMVLSELQKDAKEGAGDEVAVLRRERKRRRESESVYRENGRDDLAETEAQEAAQIETYLPAELSDADLDALAELRRERKRRRESESAYRDAGRTDLAETEAYEAAAIEGYLPAELSDADLDALVATAVAETGAEGPRDMGKAIQHVMAAAGGRADGKRVSGKVKEALSA